MIYKAPPCRRLTAESGRVRPVPRLGVARGSAGSENVPMVPDARPAGRWKPAELGVHPVAGGGPLPAYVRRPHDERLRLVLDPDVPASRLIVIRGDACAGKSRAAYEAVADRLADWRLEYPPTAAALAARLEAGIPAWTVLWLGDLCRYAAADDGAAALDRLAGLLEGEDGTWSSPRCGPSTGTPTWPRRAPGAGPAIRPGWPGGWSPGLDDLALFHPSRSRLRRDHRRPGPVHRRGTDGGGRPR